MRDPSGRPASSVFDVLLYLGGVAGVAAGITLLFLGMRAVMDVGGACADGGPYVSAQPCPEGVPIAMLLGIFGGMGSLFLAGWKGAAIGGGAVGVLFLGWPALFSALGARAGRNRCVSRRAGGVHRVGGPDRRSRGADTQESMRPTHGRRGPPTRDRSRFADPP